MKNLKFFILIVALFAMLFSSCKQEEDVTEIDLTRTDVVVSMEDFMFPNIQTFYFTTSSGDLMMDYDTGERTGSGYGFMIYFYSYVNDGGCPITKQGLSNLSPDDIEDIMKDPSLLEIGKCVVSLDRLENGEVVETIEIEDFTMEFDQNSTPENLVFRIKTTINGESIVFKYSGKPSLPLFDFIKFKQEGIEPAAITKDVDFQYNEIIYSMEVGRYASTLNVIDVALESEEWLAYFVCYGSRENLANVQGTYTVAKEHKIYTAAQSPGLLIEDGDVMGILPSVVARYNSATDEEEIFLAREGSLTIEEGKVHFDIISYEGSKISGSFVGELNIHEDGDDERYSVREKLAKIRRK